MMNLMEHFVDSSADVDRTDELNSLSVTLIVVTDQAALPFVSSLIMSERSDSTHLGGTSR